MATTEVRETVQASAEAVWNILGDFAGIKVSGPITSVEVDGDGVGAVRTISMGGAVVVEKLQAFDADEMYLKYAILNEDCPLPVSQYSATITVTPESDNTCVVQWVGQYEPKGPAEVADQIVRGIYSGGIAGARKATCG